LLNIETRYLIMKNRTLALILALGMALPVLGLAAATDASITAPAAKVTGSNYVDENNDGVCDNCGTALQGTGRGMNANTVGSNYVDENNDGVCDNCGTTLQGTGRGQGMNGRGMNSKTAGISFIDANQDGVCDNYGTPARVPAAVHAITGNFIQILPQSIPVIRDALCMPIYPIRFCFCTVHAARAWLGCLLAVYA
jgi:hypothetical protein